MSNFVAIFILATLCYGIQSRSVEFVELRNDEPIEPLVVTDMENEWPFLFFASALPVGVSTGDPIVQAAARYAVSQYNQKHSSKTVDKLVTIRAAKVAKNEFYYLTFDLGVTTCTKPNSSPDSCPLDPKQKVQTCIDVIVWVRNYKENKMTVQAFANCKP